MSELLETTVDKFTFRVATDRASAIVSVLLVAVLMGLAGCAKRSGGSNQTGAQASSGSALKASAVQPGTLPDRVVVYYLHGTRRCRTCMGIQATIEKTVQERFGAEIASGVLSFQEANIDTEDNKHFIQDFQLTSSSMVVTAKKGEATVKWQDCPGVWEHAHDEPALAAYAEKQIRSYLDLLERN
jgi:hypothetical protein